MLIERIMLLLGVDIEAQTIVEEVVTLVATPVLAYLGVKELPPELEYIVIELAIARYNRIGAEGYSEEKNDNVQNKFVETPLIEQYYPALDAWKEKNLVQVVKKGYRFF